MNRFDLRKEIGNLDIDVVKKGEDRYVQFPYVSLTTWNNSVVYQHPDMQQEIETIFEPEDRSCIDEKMVATSVTAAVIRKKLERAAKPRELEDFYRELSSSDELSANVLESMESGTQY